MPRSSDSKQDRPDIWKEIILGKREEDKKQAANREPSICFVGPIGSGKTSLLHAFVSKDPKGKGPSSTTALSYKYKLTSVGMSMEQDLTHFWELGGGRAMSAMLETPLSPFRLRDTLVIVAVDLSKPERCVIDALWWLKTVRAQCLQSLNELKSNGSDVPAQLAQQIEEAFGEHPDRNRINVMPIPTVLVGTNFDKIMDLDSEKLRIMSKTLRSVAHANGCALIYTSLKSKEAISPFRNRLSRHILNASRTKSALQLDHTRPLNIPQGADSWAQIEDAPRQVGTDALQGWSSVYSKIFPSNAASDSKEGDLPPLQLAAEPIVDSMLAAKNDELQREIRNANLKRQIQVADKKAGNNSGSK